MTRHGMHGILSKVLYKQVFFNEHADCIRTSDKICSVCILFYRKKRTTWMCGTIKQNKGGGK
ncbi:hypothetical protein C7K38_05540 [Tetragenococcus osmophilus]|uniref:Uncharacterized protein n=1 Tax=Tetragenococcus osmophilus TaxID=526944 RepID=A0ABM7A8L4_9ENTE|nr:hypothetical protein C7K38_05540 [Tetragenococcus osmophilus]